jgi:hypothetical protein
LKPLNILNLNHLFGLFNGQRQGRSSKTAIHVDDLKLTRRGKAQALQELELLRIDAGLVEDQSTIPIAVGGFGSVTVARLKDEIVAVKELRLTGLDVERGRLVCVRRRIPISSDK